VKVSKYVFFRILFAFAILYPNFGLAQLSVIPEPVSGVRNAGEFELNNSTRIKLHSRVDPGSIAFFKTVVKGLANFDLEIGAAAETNSIHLHIDSTAVPQKEGYQLIVSKNGVSIKGHDNSGLFYGVQSLIQLLKQQDGLLKIPFCEITDYPRFGYRGMHLDVGRHLFPVSAIKKWIDVLALYKINSFHWHLTEDQGWRIEIKKYPKLQQISSMRNETLIGHKRASPHKFDGKPYGGFYSQEEIREIVNYSAERHITVIPEIEMPGHAQAALAAYPQIGCAGGPYQTATYWGVFNDVFCAGKEETFQFLEQVLTEVMDLFPSTYIHIGGDECPKTSWKSCPDCQQRMKTEHLKNEEELQSYFIRRMEKFLNAHGKKIIGWDEILEGGLAPSATVMSWRGLEGGIAAAKQHHDVIMTPEKYVYLDYYQSLYPGEQIAAGGYTPLKRVYDYEPVPAELSAEESKYIKGVQANIWTEYINTPEKAEYMMFPRMFALAEIAWSQKSARNYTGFLSRLKSQEILLKQLNLNYFKNYEEVNGLVSVNSGKVQLNLHTDLPGATLHYTTTGKQPNLNSQKYTKPLTVGETGKISAAAFVKGKMKNRIFSQEFAVSKSTGKPVTLKNKPSGNFAPIDTLALVNGVTGSGLYNDGQWTGISGEDLVAVIDLEKTTLISTVGINVLKYHWQKMWEPEYVKFEVSSNGESYQEVFREALFTKEGINKIAGKIKPVKTRYIRVTAVNKGVIPKDSYGAGGKAWILADEIYVN
jgi:hexosaminidase